MSIYIALRLGSAESLTRVYNSAVIREAIKAYQKEYIKEFNKEDLLNIANQQTLSNIKDFLQPFNRVIKETEGDIATLNKVLFIIDFIVEHFKLSLVKYATNKRLYNAIGTSQHSAARSLLTEGIYLPQLGGSIEEAYS